MLKNSLWGSCLLFAIFSFEIFAGTAAEEKYKDIPKLQEFNVPKINFWSAVISEGDPKYYGGGMDTDNGTAVQMMASLTMGDTHAWACYRFEIKESNNYLLITRNKYFYAGGADVYTPGLLIDLYALDNAGVLMSTRTIYKGSLKPDDIYTTNTFYKVVTVDLGKLSPGTYEIRSYFGYSDIWKDGAPDDGKKWTKDDAYWYWDWVTIVPEDAVEKNGDSVGLNDKKTEEPSATPKKNPADLEKNVVSKRIADLGFESDTAWEVSRKGTYWEGNLDNIKSPSEKRVYRLAYSKGTPSHAGDYIRLSRKLTVPSASEGYCITLNTKDNYTGGTAGYHYKQVLIDGTVVWNEDVAGGRLDWEKVEIDVTEYVKNKASVELSLRLYDEYAVENFGVEVWWDDIALVDAAASEDTRTADQSGEKYPSWFAPYMLRESFLVRQPLNEIGGKFFMFITPDFPDRNRLRIWFRQLKWMGVTDIIYAGQQGTRLAWLSKIPYSQPAPSLGNFPAGTDPLMTVVEVTHQEGLDVWIMGHSTGYDETMSAKDADGNLYGNGKFDDLLSPKLRQFLFAVFDELAAKYNAYGNLKGYYYDEIFFNAQDYHGDDIALFGDFCRKNFGEDVPEDINERFARKWAGPPDKWRARYTLFKNKVMADFLKDIIGHLHTKGFKFIMELRPTAAITWWTWNSGMDNYLLTRQGADYYFVATGDYCEPCFVYPNALIGSHCAGSWGYYNTTAFRGQPGVHFPFWHIWKPMLSGPRHLEEMESFIKNNREWQGAKSLTRAAILTNQMGLAMSLPGVKCSEEALKEVNLLNRFSLYQDLDMLLVREKDYYRRYRLLLAPKYSLSFLPAETMDGIESYIKNGGVVVSLAGRWSTSRPDLTMEKDVGERFLGVKYLDKHSRETGIEFAGSDRASIAIGAQDIRVTEIVNPQVKVLAKFTGCGAPAVTELAIGKGKVVAFHFDVDDWLEKAPEKKFKADGLEIAPGKELGAAKEKNKGEEYIAALIAGYSSPEVKVIGDLQVKTTLRKNNWMAVSLYSKSVPAQGTLYIEPAKIGIAPEKKRYRVFLLARNRELPPPGEFGERRYWTDEELAEGIPVTITKNNDLDLKLPEKFPAEAQTGGHPLVPHIYRRWKEEPNPRSYEYEIVVIAPYNELTIDGETASSM